MIETREWGQKNTLTEPYKFHSLVPILLSIPLPSNGGHTRSLHHSLGETPRLPCQSGIPLQPCIGLDPRPVSALGTLTLGFLIHGQNVYCLKPAITNSNPLWAALRASGVTHLYDLPSLPAKITESQLTLAKPNT